MEFGDKIMWGKIKKLIDEVCVLKLATENWVKILNLRWETSPQIALL
jgi:hypothetical protein